MFKPLEPFSKIKIGLKSLFTAEKNWMMKLLQNLSTLFTAIHCSIGRSAIAKCIVHSPRLFSCCVVRQRCYSIIVVGAGIMIARRVRSRFCGIYRVMHVIRCGATSVHQQNDSEQRYYLSEKFHNDLFDHYFSNFLPVLLKTFCIGK